MSHAAQVVPSPVLSPLIRGIYIIEASRKLPVVHATKTLKTALLSPPNVQRYNRSVHRYRGLLLFSVVVATPLTSACLLFPADLGRWTAAIASPPALVSTIVAVLALRYDIVVLVLGTFEFWYRMASLSIGAAAFVMALRDARAVLAVNFLLANAMLLLMDANFRGMQWQLAVSLAGALLIFLVATLVAFSWIDCIHENTVLRIYDHTITARSIIVNSFTLSGVLSLHNAFVRRSFAQQPTNKALTTTVKCVLYRCRLRWQPVSCVSRQAVERRTVKQGFQKEAMQQRCAGLHQVINAHNTLVQTVVPVDSPSFEPWHWLVRLALGLFGASGFVSMMATFAAVASGLATSSRLVTALSLVSLFGTVSVNLVFLFYVYEVEMLRLLYTTFDFVFSLGQVFLVHLCLCDLSSWDPRVFAVVSSLLWMHWACVIDAIPPITRAQLGLNVRRVAAVIQLAFLVALLLFSVDLLAWHTQRFVNREVIPDVGYRDADGSRNANWSVGSFLFNRVANLVLWLCRCLYRQATYANEELVALRGIVEFDDYEAARREHRTDNARAKLDAIVLALSERIQDAGQTGSECGEDRE